MTGYPQMLGFAACARLPHFVAAVGWAETPDAALAAGHRALFPPKGEMGIDKLELTLQGGGILIGELFVARASWPGPVGFPQAVIIDDGEAKLPGDGHPWGQLWAHFPGAPWRVTQKANGWEALAVLPPGGPLGMPGILSVNFWTDAERSPGGHAYMVMAGDGHVSVAGFGAGLTFAIADLIEESREAEARAARVLAVARCEES